MPAVGAFDTPSAGSRQANIMQAANQREFEFNSEDFRRIVELTKERTGIVLGNQKRDLVYGRLSRRLRALGLDSFGDYCALIAGAEGEQELVLMVNAITTNLTRFFREPHHFEYLSKEILAPMVKAPAAGRRRLRLWSAGCSSGEEPYSLAMTLRNSVPALDRWDARILATDIDTDMVARAAAGHYPADRCEAIPGPFRTRYAEPHAEGGLAMGPSLKSLITFKPLNLLAAWPMQGPFDVIFCRNVVIYFDKDTQRTLFDRFADLLRKDGWLFVGHSESLFRVTDRFESIGRTIYRRVS
jgi:chemotaxis protein methyltransferase CheR